MWQQATRTMIAATKVMEWKKRIAMKRIAM
jgi:hypothetical protein